MSNLDYAALARRLKVGKGVKILLPTEQTLYLTPLKIFRPIPDTEKSKILITLSRSSQQTATGVYEWDYQVPPRSALKLTAAGFPLRSAGLIHSLLCRIFFPIKLPKPQLLLDYPRTKRGQFCKPKTKPTSNKKKTPKAPKTKTEYELNQPTKRQLARASKKARPAAIIDC